MCERNTYKPYGGEFRCARSVTDHEVVMYLACCDRHTDLVIFNATVVMPYVVRIALYDIAAEQCRTYATSFSYESTSDAVSYIGIWSSRARGIEVPDVVSWASLHDRAEELCVYGLLSPLKRGVWEMMKLKCKRDGREWSVTKKAVWCFQKLLSEMSIHELQQTKLHLHQKLMLK